MWVGLPSSRTFPFKGVLCLCKTCHKPKVQNENLASHQYFAKRAIECFSSILSRGIAIPDQAELTFSELPFIIFSSLLRLSFPALIFNGSIGPVFAGTRSSSSTHSARFLKTSERIVPPQPLGIKRSFALYCHKSHGSNWRGKWLNTINKSHSIQGLLW